MISGMTVKLTISLPDDLAAEVRAAVQAGRAPTVSAYVAKAINAMHDAPGTLTEFLDEWEAEAGRPSAEAKAWAKDQLSGFAQVSQRKAAG
jgi:Arc/MetJ-type ribon-helix-helix transcriptional regulator